MASSTGIHFIGHWTDAERRRLRRALTTLERAWAAPDSPSAVEGSPNDSEWIVVQESPPWVAHYFAHCLGTPNTLTGRSADELASVIERSSRMR
jgi:hypothetical protein